MDSLQLPQPSNTSSVKLSLRVYAGNLQPLQTLTT